MFTKIIPKEKPQISGVANGRRRGGLPPPLSLAPTRSHDLHVTENKRETKKKLEKIITFLDTFLIRN